jgi:hypothetical protein
MNNIASILPSTRDFLQAIASRRRRLVLVPLVDRPDDASALAAAGVTAFAVAGPGEAMRAVSAAVGANPVVSLAAVASPDDALTARAHGADAVVLNVLADAALWSSLAKNVISTRMAPLACAIDEASALLAAASAARGAYLRVESVAAIQALAAKLPSLRILAHVPSADEKALRALRGVVDAAIVESDLFLSTSFATLREELDP